MRRFLAHVALASLAATCACSDWRSHVDPTRAAAEPEQVALVDEPVISFEARGYEVRLTPRASYQITAYAVDTSRTLLDEWDFALPMDLALAWGPVADPAVLRKMKFHLSGRYVSWWYEDGSLPRRSSRTHVANHHLVPGERRRGPGDEAGEEGRSGHAAGQARRRRDPRPRAARAGSARAPASPGATSARGPASRSGSRRSR